MMNVTAVLAAAATSCLALSIALTLLAPKRITSVDPLCCSTSAVSIVVRWPRGHAPTSTAIEVQVAHAGSKGWTPFLSVVSFRPEAEVHDLAPASMYELRLRLLRGTVWTALTERRLMCVTPPILATQPLVLPPELSPEPRAVFVPIVAPACQRHSTKYVLEYAATAAVAVGELRWQHVILAAEEGLRPLSSRSVLRLQGLAPGQSYWVRARLNDSTADESHVSPRVLFRTQMVDVESLNVYRISEICGVRGRRPCSPDYLSDRAASDARALAYLLLVWYSPLSARPSGIAPPSLDGVLISRYCVQRSTRLPWSEYSSCDNVRRTSNTYRCNCQSWFDRLQTRHDPEGCVKTAPAVAKLTSVRQAHSLLHTLRCNCSARSRRDAARSAGRQQVYWPPPTECDWSRPTCRVLPAADSLPAGTWYSLPGGAECKRGEQLHPSASCSWRIAGAQMLVNGAALLSQGRWARVLGVLYRMNGTFSYDAAQPMGEGARIAAGAALRGGLNGPAAARGLFLTIYQWPSHEQYAAARRDVLRMLQHELSSQTSAMRCCGC